MRKTKLLLIAMSLMLLTACSSSLEEQQETINYRVNIDGERNYISDDDEDVISAKEVALGYLTHYVDKDYKKDGNMEILPYVGGDLFTSYEQNNIVQRNQEAIRAYELTERLDSYEIDHIQMYTLYGQPSAEILLTFYGVVENATDAYLESIAMKAGSKYRRTLTYQLTKMDEGWKITGLSLGAREVVE